MVDIDVRGPEGAVLPTMAVVDSGADSSALPLSLAKPLGIDLDDDCEELEGMSAGGKSTQWLYPAGLRAEVFGREFKMVAMFTETPLILLGQADFFKQFHVAFDGRAEEFTLRAY